MRVGHQTASQSNLVAASARLKLFILILSAISILTYTFDANAGRRSLRIEPGGDNTAWSDGAAICEGTSAIDFSQGGPHSEELGLDLRGIIFSVSDDSFQTLTECQRTTANFDGFDFLLSGDSQESGIVVLVGANSGNVITGLRYSSGFIDCCQWIFIIFPNNVTLVRFRGFDGLPLTAGTNIREGDEFHFRGDLWPDYDGEFFCFQDGEFRGVWDEETFTERNPLPGCSIEGAAQTPTTPPPTTPQVARPRTGVITIPAISLLLSDNPRDRCASDGLFDCNLNCIDRSTALAWSTDLVCDDGGFFLNDLIRGFDVPVFLNCQAYNFDGGACN